jgi:hypothetical protein
VGWEAAWEAAWEVGWGSGWEVGKTGIEDRPAAPWNR